MTQKCRACGGTYESITHGMPYFHSCPDVWSVGQKKYVPRPNKRNENLVIDTDDVRKMLRNTHIKNGKPKKSIKAQGAGVDTI